MHITKALGFAGALILSAIVGGTLIGSAFALDEPDTGTSADHGGYCETFMEALASELGVTRDALAAAGRSAAGATVDAAVASGDLSEERAADIRARIAEADGTACAWVGGGFGRGFGHGLARGFLGGDVFEAAADALGVESSDLLAELRDATSLESVASEHGADYGEVKDSIVDAVRADLEAAGLEAERVDAVIERLTSWLDAGGKLEAFGRGPLGGHHWRFAPDDDGEGDSGA